MMLRFSWFVFLTFVCGIVFFNNTCNAKSNYLATSQDDVETALSNINWKELSEKTIYIGHRSVGNNLIQGIHDYIRSNPQISLSIVNIDETTNFTKNGIFHSWVSGDGSPQTIAKDYIRLIENKLKKKVDIAYLRFTPFYGDRNLNKVLTDYKEAQAILKKKYPDTIFIHGTFPIIYSKTTIKTWIKKFIKPDDIWEYAQNIYSNKYNFLIRKNFGKSDAFFDFEKIQSTYQDGKRAYFSVKGKKYYQMVSDYTYDGTHLNEKGKKIVAERFCLFLAALIGK